MKLVSFIQNGESKYGALMPEQEVAVLSDVFGSEFPALKNVIRQPDFIGMCQNMIGNSQHVSLESVELLPPIPDSEKIICVGLNYHDHREETGHAPTTKPTLFSRFSDSQCAHGKPILLPECSSELDFEAELAAIIGQPVERHVEEATALTHVAGYSCYNDGSIRDWQTHSTQFLPGKNFKNTGGFGPCLVTKNEIPDPQNLMIECRLNGETVQKANTSQMIHSLAQIISYISQFTTLNSGDVIVSGTPGGVGFARKPPLFMKVGDLVEVEIEYVGLLKNQIAAA